MKKSIWITMALVSAVYGQNASATLSDASTRFTSDLGTLTEITATKTCDLDNMTGHGSSNLGTVNTLLCVLKSTFAVTGTGSATKTVTIGGETMTVHYELTSPGITADGVTYDFSLKLWTCGTGCTETSAFYPAIFASFSTSSDGATNKGILINNYSASSGSIKGTSFIRWDTGSGTTTKNITLNMVDCSSSPTYAGYTVYKRTGDVATLANLGTSTANAVTRNAFSLDYSANTGNWYTDTTVSAGGDSPAWGGGFTRAVSGTDYAYTAGSIVSSQTIDAFPTAISGTVLSSSTNQGTSCAAATATGVATVNNGSNVLTTTITANGGMDQHPSSI